MISKDNALFGIGASITAFLLILIWFTWNSYETQKQLIVEFEALHKEVTHHKTDLREVYEAMCDIEEATWIDLPTASEAVKTR